MPSALAAIEEVNRPNLRLLIDAMHIFRSGSMVADLAAIDPDRIGYIQLCDVPLQNDSMSYTEEARYARLAPGQGELPLLEMLKVLPRDGVVGLEIPMLAEAQAGIAPRDRLAAGVKAARDLLERSVS
jgi:sugar phosphate isomerase/epimerase